MSFIESIVASVAGSAFWSSLEELLQRVRRRPSHPEPKQESPAKLPVAISAKVHRPPARDDYELEEAFDAAWNEHVIVELVLTNQGGSALEDVVGEATLVGADKRELNTELWWSKEPGPHYVAGGGYEVRIASKRVVRLLKVHLLVNKGFHPLRSNGPQISAEPEAYIPSDRCSVRLRFKADGYPWSRFDLPLKHTGEGVEVGEVQEVPEE